MQFTEILNFIGSYKKKPSQQRSNKTVEDLYQTAREILESDLDVELSSKLLSEKSGYSAGVIYRYFNKFEDIFISLFTELVDKHFEEVQQIFVNHQAHEPIDKLIEKLVEHGFNLFSKRTVLVKNLPLLTNLVMRRLKDPAIVFKVNDRLLPYMMELQKNDLTHTFETMSELECISRLRAFDLFMRVPFVSSNNTFDLLEHKNNSYKFGVLIFSKHSVQ
jgi:AcrR family transcriptional regulator